MEARWKNEKSDQAEFSYHCYHVDGQLIEENLHSHERFELVLIVRGAGEWFMEGRFGMFKAGSVFLIAPRLVHFFRSSTATSAVEAIVVHFPKAVLPRGLLNIVEARPLKNLLAIAQRGLAFEAQDADRIRFRMQALLRSKGMFRIARLHVLLELIAMQSRTQVADYEEEKDPVSRSQARVMSAKRFIDTHCERAIGREEVATFLGIDEASFSRLFRKETGVAFSEYLVKVRVQKAARWLTVRKGFSVAEVARRSGFHNLSSFNKQFKKHLGMTPLAYRKAADVESLAP